MSTRRRTLSAMAAATAERVMMLVALVLVVGTARGASFENDFHAMLSEAMQADTREAVDRTIDRARQSLAGRGAFVDAMEREFLEADLLRTQGGAYALLARKDPKRFGALVGAARGMLESALGRYQGLEKSFTEKAGKMAETLPEETLDKNREYRQANASSWRAKYRVAWLEYRLAELADPRFDAASRTKHLTAAAGIFNEFTLMGEAEEPMSDIVLDCFLGEALCYRDMNDHRKVVECLVDRLKIHDRIRGSLRPPERRSVFSQLFRVLLESYEGQGDRAALESAADQYFRSVLPQEYSSTELDMVFMRARNLHALVAAGRATKPQQNTLNSLTVTLDGYGDPWCTKLDKLLGRDPTSTSHGRLREAGERFRARDYEKAIEIADKVINLNPSAPGTANAREIKAAGLWNLKRWREAHLAAFSFVTHHPTDPRAELWCQRAFQAGLKALKETPPLETEQLLSFFDAVATKRPDDEEVRKIPWYRGYVLIESGDYVRAYRSLLAVRDPKAPVYRQAQYGIALSCWKQAESFMRAKDARRTMDYLARAREAVERFVDAPAPAGDDDKADRQMNDAVAYLANQVARALLDQPTPSTTEILALLGKLDDAPMMKDLRADGRLTLRIETECMKEGPAQAAVRINDYITGSAGAPVAQAAANIVSRLEKACDALAAEDKKKEAEELAWHILRIYEFLLTHVRRAPNATADMEAGIRGRLGHAYLRLEKYADAVAHFESALAHSPRSADLRRGLAVALEKTGRNDRAVLEWRILAKGLERGSEGWFEAHYERIRCYLAMNERDQARTLLRYYLEYLHPEDAPASWTKKFRTLDVEMGAEDPPANTVPPAGPSPSTGEGP